MKSDICWQEIEYLSHRVCHTVYMYRMLSILRIPSNEYAISAVYFIYSGYIHADRSTKLAIIPIVGVFFLYVGRTSYEIKTNIHQSKVYYPVV